jgi:guanylate kinase
MKKILLLLGASGSGKSTIGTFLQTLGIPELISHSTRKPRWDEIDGKSYYFVTKEKFDKIDKLEYSDYSNNYYCLSRAEVERHKENLVYCVVDSHGAEQIIKNYGKENVVVIYVNASYQEMRERMGRRGDSPEKIEERIKYAIETDEKYNDCKIADYFVDNGDLDICKQEVFYIINKLKKEMNNEEKTIL